MGRPRIDWTEMTTEEFRDPDVSSWIAVLPVAAVEQHGPHLPVGVDSMIAQGYLDRVRAEIPQDLAVTILPAQSIGCSEEHVGFPGTLSFAPETAIRAWTEIGLSVARAGVRKLVLVNSHGGNSPILDLVARTLRSQADMLVVTASWRRLGYPAGLFSSDEMTHGIHAGEVETSLMLAFRPDMVRREQAENFRPLSYAMAETYTHLRACGPIGFGWMSSDLHPSGAAGNAASATAEAGEELAYHGAHAFVELLRDVDRFSLPGWAPHVKGVRTA